MTELYGKTPRSEAGRCFALGNWAWRALVTLVSVADLRARGRLVGDEALERMANGNGAGLETQEASSALAKQLEIMLDNPCLYREHGLELITDGGEPTISVPAEDSGFLVDPSGRLYVSGAVPEPTAKSLELKSAFRVQVSEVRRFIQFLRTCGCGGFSIA